MTSFIIRGLVVTELFLVYAIGGIIFGVGLQILLNIPLGPQVAPSQEISLVPFFVAGILQVPVATMGTLRKSRSILTASLTGPLVVVIACTIFHPASLGFTPAAMEWVERRSSLSLISGSVLLVVYALDRMAGRILLPDQRGLLRRTEKLVDQSDRGGNQRGRQ